MDSTLAGRPMTSLLSLTAATAIMFTSSSAPPIGQISAPAVPRVSIEAVQLTALPEAFQQVWDIATGNDAQFPLPTGINPVAPITEQVIRSVATYATQLVTGQAGKIPGEISAQFNRLQEAGALAGALFVDALATAPTALFSAAFNTVLVIGSLPQSASALSALPGIWLNAVAIVPLKWAYNAFAIRNTIAWALQPPTAQSDPVASTATATATATATTRSPAIRVKPRALDTRAALRIRAHSPKATANRAVVGAPKRAAAAGSQGVAHSRRAADR